MNGDVVRVLIVDDEPIARRGVRRVVEAEPGFEVVGECSDGAMAVAAILEQHPDLVLLDIQMPELDGFGVVEAVGVERMPVVVFITAYDQHTLRAFEVHALDYILKPYEHDRFRTALQRAREQVRRRTGLPLQERLQALLESISGPSRYLDRVAVRSSGRILFLGMDEIDWFEAADNYVRLHSGSRSFLLQETLSGLEAKLDPTRFIRVHRSRIVNVHRIKELHPMFHGEYVVVLQNGAEVGTGRSYKDRMQALVGNSPEVFRSPPTR